MGGQKRKRGAGRTTALRPYYEVRSDEPEAREALNKLVGFDVGEMARRGWEWIEARAPRKWNESADCETVSIPGFVAGESVEVTKARALIGELTGSLMSLKSMHGPERTAGRRWNDALGTLLEALEAFMPFAQVRGHETSFFASKVSPGGRAHYDAVHAQTVRIAAIAEDLAATARLAQTKITTYKDDPLPGLQKRKPHRTFLAQICTRLSLAGFTLAEIGDLIPDPLRLEEERLEAAYIASNKSNVTKNFRENLTKRRERYRNDHAERIRSLVSGVKPEIVRARALSALADRALQGFMERTGRQIGDAGKWFDEYLKSPEGLAVSKAELEGERSGE